MQKLIAALLVLTVTGCASHQEATQDESTPVAPSNPTETEPAPSPTNISTLIEEPEITKAYNSLEELAQVSEIAFEGKVLETTPFDYYSPVGDTKSAEALTKVTLQVKKALSDNIKTGDIITVIESGGITTKKALGMGEKFPDMTEEQLNEKVLVKCFDLSPSAVHEEVLVFAFPTRKLKGPNGETYYQLPGIFQGKFKIKGDLVARDVPRSIEQNYKKLESKLNETETKVQELMKGKKK